MLRAVRLMFEDLENILVSWKPEKKGLRAGGAAQSEYSQDRICGNTAASQKILIEGKVTHDRKRQHCLASPWS